jgi:hypothetical protein
MTNFGIPRRASGSTRPNTSVEINWRRGLFRIWLLLSAAWIMGWVVNLILFGIQVGFQNYSGLLSIPVLLLGPPTALLLFGLAARWAFRGFKPDDDDLSNRA